MSGAAVVGFASRLGWKQQRQDERECGFKPKNIFRLLSLTRRRLCVLGISACCKNNNNSAASSPESDWDPWEEEKSGKCCCWCGCGRRNILASALGMSLATGDGLLRAAAEGLDDAYRERIKAIHPKRPDWYEELYARTLKFGMVSYEAEVARYKERLFAELKREPQHAEETTTVVELGIGTGPNLKYYARSSGMNVVGLDPNDKMEKYARDAAADAGLRDSQFKFIHAVGEEIPLPSSSADAVVSTLVLCSVTDLGSTLKEINRILKPGARFYFLEHVAAQEGSSLRFWQGLLDPVQQLVADGCHLTRDTLSHITSAGLSGIAAERIHVSSVSLISPHIVGTAQASSSSSSSSSRSQV